MTVTVFEHTDSDGDNVAIRGWGDDLMVDTRDGEGFSGVSVCLPRLVAVRLRDALTARLAVDETPVPAAVPGPSVRFKVTVKPYRHPSDGSRRWRWELAWTDPDGVSDGCADTGYDTRIGAKAAAERRAKERAMTMFAPESYDYIVELP